MARAKLHRTKRSKAVKPRAPSKPIKIYWWMSRTRELYYSYLDQIVGDAVYFTDGGWNSVKDCFLSEEQARRNPSPDILAQDVVETRGIVTELSRACHTAELGLRELDKQVSRLRGEG